MRILVNASTCVVGGGVQVASCFINYLSSQKRDLTNDWFFALSQQVANECDEDFLRKLRGENRLFISSVSPGSLIKGRVTRIALAKACYTHKCESVFTIFGPSYVNFNVPENMGFADAFAFSPTVQAYKWHPISSRILGRLTKSLKLRFAAGARRYWVEAQFAKEALVQALSIDEERITVIPNCVNTRISAHLSPCKAPAMPTFFFLAAGYWHKNHMMIPAVLRTLCSLRPGIRLSIVTTLPQFGPLWHKFSAELKRMGVANMVQNVGPLKLSQVAEKLCSSTAVMQISLLETFSSTYLEAMASEVPLLVSDRPFARDICGSAAVYANPLDALDIANKMLSLVDNPDLRHRLAVEGRTQISKFPSAEVKNEKLYEFCTQ